MQQVSSYLKPPSELDSSTQRSINMLFTREWRLWKYQAPKEPRATCLSSKRWMLLALLATILLWGRALTGAQPRSAVQSIPQTRRSARLIPCRIFWSTSLLRH
jgi:hypothetical protein